MVKCDEKESPSAEGRFLFLVTLTVATAVAAGVGAGAAVGTADALFAALFCLADEPGGAAQDDQHNAN